MTERERLIEIITNYRDDISFCDICKRPVEDCEVCATEQLADYLIANGVIVPPCNVGDTVYKIAIQRDNFDDREYPIVIQVPFTIERLNSIGKTVFLTKEEAEKALKECKGK